MTTKFMNKCRSFATDIKQQSGSIFSDTITSAMFENLDKTYLQCLRCKRNAIHQNYNDPYFHFTAKNENVNDIESFVLKPSHNFNNDQILKIIISIEMFYLSYQKIKLVIDNLKD